MIHPLRIGVYLIVSILLIALITWQLRSGRNEKHVLFGVALSGHPITGAALGEVKQTLSGTPHIVAFYLQWPEDPSKGFFPTASLDAIWNGGSIPCLTWEPMFIHGDKEFAIEAKRILKGEFDEYLDLFARETLRWKKPLLIRFAHEMNLDRYHWGSSKEAYGPDSPKRYQELFQYVVSRFRKHGQSRVSWVFNPNAESVPQAPWNSIAAYYPGDAFVDILGMDGYAWGVDHAHGGEGSPHSFSNIFLRPYQDLKALSLNKKILVFETATAGDSDYKKSWLRNAFTAAKRWDLDGIVWFTANKERDWRLPDLERTAWNRRQESPSGEFSNRDRAVEVLFGR